MATTNDSDRATRAADAAVAVADTDGVFPEGFYATTNFPTEVRINGVWVPVERCEMDVGIRIVRSENVVHSEDVVHSERAHPVLRAESCPMHRVVKGDALVVGDDGVGVVMPKRTPAEADAFRFMSSGISTERPKARLIADVAVAMKEAHAAGKRILFVGGPAIVHSGSASHLEALIRGGWIDVLFAGNALAAHDIEAAIFGTSLGVSLTTGEPAVHGHQHHLRAINRVRRAGSIATAVRHGLVSTGIMHACITNAIPFVLAGSIRDDGPLPDVITDVVAATDAMRAQAHGVGLAIIVATTLHGVATGNILPAGVPTFCVDTSAGTVIKLVDRGTHQAIGIVTDCEYFLGELHRAL